MRLIKSILVGVDFTPGCEPALREAIRLSKAHSATLHALHIMDTQIAMDMESTLTGMQESIRRGLISDAQTQWRTFVARVPEAAQLAVEVRIEHRVRGLLEMARQSVADLIVLGINSSGRPDIGLGTVATSFVRHASTDVLLVRPDRLGRFAVVVAGIDFSETSGLALQRALQLAGADSGHVHIVHAFAPPWTRLHYRAPTVPSEPNSIEQAKAQGEQKLRAFAAPHLAAFPGVQSTFILEETSGYRTGIVEYAERVKANLVCVGTRGQSNFRDFVLGSTAEKVLAQSKASVLAVRPAGAAA